MINENVDATTNKQDITATTWKYKKIEVIWLLFWITYSQKKEPKLAYPIVAKPTKNREKTEKKYSTEKKGKFWIKSGNKKKSQISNKKQMGRYQ